MRLNSLTMSGLEDGLHRYCEIFINGDEGKYFDDFLIGDLFFVQSYPLQCRTVKANCIRLYISVSRIVSNSSHSTLCFKQTMTFTRLSMVEWEKDHGII